jgi:hypothetical protein
MIYSLRFSLLYGTYGRLEMTLGSREKLGLPGRFIMQCQRTFLLISKHRSQEQTTLLSKQMKWTKALTIHRHLGLDGMNNHIHFT